MIIPCVKKAEHLLKKIMEGAEIIKIQVWDGERSPYNLKMFLNNKKVITMKSYKSGLEVIDIEVKDESNS